jgi:hypothetical protein
MSDIAIPTVRSRLRSWYVQEIRSGDSLLQETYEWYMEHLFDYHEKEARRYSKQRAKPRGGKTVSYSSSLDLSGTEASASDLVQEMFDYHRYVMFEAPGRSKWERIGKPMVMNTFDQFIVLNPHLTPKMRAAALSRQIEEFSRHYERSGLGF